MSREEEIRNLRIEKIQKLKNAGFDVFPDPATTEPSSTIKEIVDNFSVLEKEGREHKIVGRIMIKRGAGKIAFANIFDGTETFQVVLQEDVLGLEQIKLFDKLFDMGDFAIFSGILFTTQKGEKSLKVLEFKIVGKTILPMPEK
ncbi:Lysyl-tRNA synthetase [sediment metagenome]|uniref:Lysyl-tRNA synthetase n=1 Tax=sediment metagenome TaxID=749907 RepID=D9PIG6_9ZZZZ